MKNMDLICARLGEKLFQYADDKTLTSSLGVLEEQGVYAFFLYLKANSSRENKHQDIISACFDFLETNLPEGSWPDNEAQAKKPFPQLQSLGENLDNLFLAHNLLRQALVYGRYHAKARPMDKE